MFCSLYMSHKRASTACAIGYVASRWRVFDGTDWFDFDASEDARAAYLQLRDTQISARHETVADQPAMFLSDFG
jgi:hypothetical protein